mgnify:FL=1
MMIAEYIGDEVSAAGYRLCGVHAHSAEGHNVSSLIRQACERASLVLVGSSVVQHLHAAELDSLLASISPPVLIVADFRGSAAVPDIATRLHKQLGMLE